MGDPLPPPSLPAPLPTTGGTGSARFNASGSSSGTTVSYRVLAEPTTVQGLSYTAIVAIPLDDLHHTLGRLVLVELLVLGAVILGLGALAWWIVRRGLRPLEEMATTAGAIAAGDLSQRVASTDERTEVGQLGNALNVMLSGIEHAFAARAASEERLRRFLADASHELRTPLTSIRGYSELFDRGAGDRPEDLATSMRHIREEANRMSEFVADLLLLARLDHQRPIALEHVDLAAIVTAAAVHAARVSAPERAITLEAPARWRSRVTPTGSARWPTTSSPTPSDTPPRAPPSGCGCGSSRAPPASRSPTGARVSRPRSRRRSSSPSIAPTPPRTRATGGVGLGLTIVAAIARAHGGTVGVVSDPTPENGRRGATFWVRIPLAGAAALAAPVAGPVAVPVPSGAVAAHNADDNDEP